MRQNSRTIKLCRLFVSISMLLISTPLFAEQPPPNMPPMSPGAITPGGQLPVAFNVERISAGIFRIGSVLINKAERSVTFPAEINMNKGLLEYLLVRSSGKTHESLLRTSINPSDLQLALLLLGLEGTAKPISAQGAAEVPTGEPVIIYVSVTQPDGRIFDFSPEAWIVKKVGETMQPPGRFQFVFTGSQIVNGRFLAEIDGSMISIYHDPAAIIDNASPGGESDEIWFVKDEGVPKVGTPVTVTIRSLK